MKEPTALTKHILLLALLAAVSVFVAYQSRTPMKIAVGDPSNQFVSGFYDERSEPGHTFRWTWGKGRVTFAGVGKSPLRLTVVANAWRYENQIFTATVTVNGYPVGVIDRAGWRTWRFDVSDPAILSGDELAVGFNSTPFIPSEIMPDYIDDDPLGIAVDSVEIQSGAVGGVNNGWSDWLVIPSLPQSLFVIGFVLGVYLFARYLTLREQWAFALGLAVILLFAIGTAFFLILASQRILIWTVAVGMAAVLIVAQGWKYSGANERGAIRRMAWWVIPAGVALVALLLRIHALAILPVEGDDGLYMKVAEEYAKAIQAADWNHVIALDGVIEHPRLYVLCFSTAIVLRDAVQASLSNVAAMRLVAAFFGAVQAGLIALLNPLSGWFLAIQTTEIKFTSMAYLEALPALTAALSVIAFERFRRTAQSRWLYLSAIALGATGASKFIYIIAGFAILPFLLWEQRRQPQKIVVYGLVAAIAFFALDPYLWYDPVGRLQEMFSFHGSFSTREYVQELARPWWYNVVWLAGPAKIYAPDYRFPNIFLISWDTLIYGLAVLGLPSLMRTSRLYFAWLVVGVIFVSLWQAKWEQYSLVIATPLCMAAGYFVADASAWMSAKWQRRLSKGLSEELYGTSNGN